MAVATASVVGMRLPKDCWPVDTQGHLLCHLDVCTSPFQGNSETISKYGQSM
jgi:hypothetical protein